MKIIGVVLAGLLWLKLSAAQVRSCARVVSLAPSLTETFYALELGDNIVGVSEYSNFPPQAKAKPKVGALLDLNLEAVYSLKPSLVFMLIEHGRAARQLKDLGLDVEVLDQRSVRGIFEAISTIGAVCGKKDQARDLNRKLEEETEAVKRWVGAKPAKRVMVVVSSFGANTNIYVSGQDGFYADLIKLAGGLSVPQGGTFGLANLSIESVMALRPDVIVEIGYGKSTTAELKQAALRRWHPFADIPAVRTGQIYVLNEDYSSIPGPRFTKLLWDFARLIHANAN